MLSIALGWAEVLGSNDIFCGVNAVDYSGYPDCRPAFIESFQQLANLATKAGIEGQGLRIHAPLMAMGKADIVREGLRLSVLISPQLFPVRPRMPKGLPVGIAMPAACARKDLPLQA